MIKPTRPYILFNSQCDNAMQDTLEFLKSLSLLSPKATKIKKFMYKGIYVSKPTECKVIGYVDENEIILDIKGEIHSIMPDYLKEMQSRKFEM